MSHSEVQGIYAPKIFSVEGMLPANLRARPSIEIGSKASYDRIEYGDAGNAEPRTVIFELGSQRIVDNGEKHDTWLAFDFTQHALELTGGANKSINVFEGLKIGVMGGRCPCHCIERLTRRV
jgi:hypothetical protein